jgi:hypothetical protein
VREEECIRRFGGKARRKQQIGRPGHKREDNIEIYLKDIGCGVMKSIHLAHDMDQWRTLSR